MSLDMLTAGSSIFSAPGAAGAGGSALLSGGASAGAGMLAGFAGGPIAGIAGMVLSGIASQQAARAKKKADQRAELGSMNASAYEKALQDYYIRKNKQERRMGLENYNQFNTMEQIAPGYKDVYKPGAVGTAPDARNYVAGNNKNTNSKNYKYISKDAAAGQGSVTLPGG